MTKLVEVRELFSLTGAILGLLGLSASRVASGAVRRHIYNNAGSISDPAVSVNM